VKVFEQNHIYFFIRNLILTYKIQRVRGKSIAISTASNWLFNWAIAYATPYLVDDAPGSAKLGSHVFFIWGGANFLCFFFAYFFVYETKGLSLESVDELYETYSHAWKSRGFVPTDHKFSKEVGHIRNESEDEQLSGEKTNVTNIERLPTGQESV